MTLQDEWFDRVFQLNGTRVLVVDDSRDVRELITMILERCSANVTSVGTAAEALDVLQHERPDVLVSDISMPERDGFWLIAAVRALPAAKGGGTPAAAVTSHASSEDRALILQAGYQFHVVKPVSPGRLAGVVALLAMKI